MDSLTLTYTDEDLKYTHYRSRLEFPDTSVHVMLNYNSDLSGEVHMIAFYEDYQGNAHTLDKMRVPGWMLTELINERG